MIKNLIEALNALVWSDRSHRETWYSAPESRIGRILAINIDFIADLFSMSALTPQTPSQVTAHAANDASFNGGFGSPRINSEPGQAGQPSDLKITREIEYWLDWQARMISGVIRGGVFLQSASSDNSQFEETAWPETSEASQALRKLAWQSLRTGKPVVRSNISDGTGVIDIVACPVKRNKQPIGAVVFSLTSRTDSQTKAVLQLLQWCVVWLENLLNAQADSPFDSIESISEAVTKISAIAPLAVTGHQLCGYLAEKFSCSMVALGVSEGLAVRVVSISNQLGFDRRTSRMSELEFAMGECLEQNSRIVANCHEPSLTSVTRAHEHLLRQNGGEVACSIPLKTQDSPIGVLTLIKNVDNGFDTDQLNTIGAISTAIGPIVALQKYTDQSFVKKLGLSCVSAYRRMVGPKNIKLKTIGSLLVLTPLLLMTFPAEHRVSVEALLEGSMQQAVVAPREGYIKTVAVRAGDKVKTGQVLVSLDDSALVLQYEKWKNELDKLNRQHQLAWAERDRAQVTILASKMAQSKAQIELIESERIQSTITAPFDGLLISGDLTQLVGAPIERGQLLYQLVPVKGFKLILRVNEFDIGKLEDGQKGVLRLSAMPDERIEFEIQKAFPVASVSNKQSTFRVEAVLTNPPAKLRPGMKGIGRVVVDQSTLGDVWTRSLRERIKMGAWYFGF